MFIDETILNIMIGFLLALLLASVVFWWYDSKKSEEKRVLDRTIITQKQQLSEQALLLATYQERLEQQKHNRVQMKQEFENLAHKILQSSTQNLSRHNTQTLSHIINPFKEDIKSFHDRVESYYTQESKERYSLVKEIHTLQTLNQQISQDAINLTNALKGDNKIQGDWGETILVRVLESSGLKSGREFILQNSFLNDKRERFRPDAIINLPRNRQLVIDAKVSLKSYERYYHDTAERARHKKEFLHSIKMHIKGLSEKSYQSLEGVETLDFVLLFIPIEGAFILASSEERRLFDYAYQKNIMIVSPSTLLAVIRVIENAWRFEYQNKNAKVIAKKAGDLYDKFSGFVSEMQKIETALHKANDAYDDAFKKLSTGKGNLMNKTKELKALQGAREDEVES